MQARPELLALALGVVAGGCSSSNFVCQSSVQCEGGICEESGFCSFPSEGCESLRRYGKHAGGGLAGQCVPNGAGTSSTTETTNSGTTTDAASTGQLLPFCGDGMVSDNEVCDDGNDVDADGCNTDCVVSGTLRWIVTQDVDGADDKTYAVVVDDAGSILAAGYSTDPADQRYRWFRIEADPQGALVSSEFDGPNEDGLALGLVVDAQSVRIEVGQRIVTGAESTGLIRTSGGAPEWTFELPVVTGCRSSFDEVRVGPSGELYVAGKRCDTDDNSWPYLAAIELGASAPTWEFNGEPTEEGPSHQLGLDLTAGGSIVLGGSQMDETTGDRDVTIYEVSGQGDELWRGTYSSPGVGNDAAGPVAVLVDGSILAGGHHAAEDGSEFWVGRFEPPLATPVQVFTARGDGDGDRGSNCESLLATEDGGFIAAGYLDTAMTADDLLVIRYAANGDEVWRDQRDIAGLDDRLFSIALAPDGDVVVSGYSRTASEGSDYLIVRYAP